MCFHNAGYIWHHSPTPIQVQIHQNKSLWFGLVKTQYVEDLLQSNNNTSYNYNNSNCCTTPITITTKTICQDILFLQISCNLGGRQYHSCVVYKHYLYFFGGFNGTNYNDLFSFDSSKCFIIVLELIIMLVFSAVSLATKQHYTTPLPKLRGHQVSNFFVIPLHLLATTLETTTQQHNNQYNNSCALLYTTKYRLQ